MSVWLTAGNGWVVPERSMALVKFPRKTQLTTSKTELALVEGFIVYSAPPRPPAMHVLVAKVQFTARMTPNGPDEPLMQIALPFFEELPANRQLVHVCEKPVSPRVAIVPLRPAWLPMNAHRVRLMLPSVSRAPPSIAAVLLLNTQSAITLWLVALGLPEVLGNETAPPLFAVLPAKRQRRRVRSWP